MIAGKLRCGINQAGRDQDCFGVLEREDRILWDAVRRTARALGKRGALLCDAKPSHEPSATNAKQFAAMQNYEAGLEKVLKGSIAAGRKLNNRDVVALSRSVAPAESLDKTTLRKLAKGRMQIDGQVDLHGLTQERAHDLLLRFMHSARQRGLRYVIVITGKGSSRGGDGVLKHAVPLWLNTAPFRMLVSSFNIASHNHGGTGALYVRLRRKMGTER